MSDRAAARAEAASFAAELQRLVILFSTGWLAAANLVGVWLACLLVFPAWNAFFGEWTYGRWMALHLNWHLYGWCSLPMVGLLLRHYLHADPETGRQVRGVFFVWSLALALGGLSWLQGETSGKLFLDWSGLPRLILVGAMGLLWCLLASHTSRGSAEAGTAPRRRLLDRGVLVVLAAVPPLLYWSTGRRVYPAVDPGTGGPTGASLLGSTLVIVLVIALLPKLLGLAVRRDGKETLFRVWFGVDSAIFMLLNHGNRSHHEWGQIVGLASLLIWVPALAWYLRRFSWNPDSRPWLTATLCWWAALVVSGFVSFLPGLLDRIKFTHALVAHAHLAMAGLLTSVNMLVLLNLALPRTEAAAPLTGRGAFLCWHGGLLLQIAALSWLTRAEIADPGQLFRGGDAGGYVLRLAAGLLMAGASVCWAAGTLRTREITLGRLALS